MRRVAMVVLAGCAGAEPPTREFTTDTLVDGGSAAADPDSFGTLLCVAADRTVYVSWRDDRVEAGRVDQWLSASPDGGVTWRAPVQVNHGGRGVIGDAVLACDEVGAWLVWADDREADGVPHLYANGTVDRGASVAAADARVDGGSGPAVDPDLVRAGGALTVAFSRADGSVAAVRSDDDGATWGPELTVSATGEEPVAVAVGEGVGIGWLDDGAGLTDVFFGRTDGAASSRLDGDEPGASPSSLLDLCADGDHVHAVWSDQRYGDLDVFLSSSADGGRTWDAAPFRLDGTKDLVDPPGLLEDEAGSGPSFGPRCVATGTTVVVAWADRPAPYLEPDVFVRVVEGGVPERAARRVDVGDAAGGSPSWGVQISADPSSGAGAIVWHDARDADQEGFSDLYYAPLGDAADYRLDSMYSGRSVKADARAAVVGDRVYAAWTDYRSGNGGIYFTSLALGSASDPPELQPPTAQ